MSSGKAAISSELAMVLLCKRMQWDYYTYLAQPQWFIKAIEEVDNIEATYNKRALELSQKRRR